MHPRLLALASLLAFLGPATPDHDGSLRQAATGSGILVGAAVRPALLAEPAYAATLSREFSMVEPEDALKWEIVHPAPDVFDFTAADQVLEFASQHNMKVRGHTLCWHRQNPSWLTEGRFTREQLAKLLENHIREVVGRYRGRIFAWDVVNEAFDEVRPGQLRTTLWHNAPGITTQSGYAYIEHCFRWAHAADPQALLFYNDAEAEVVNAKSDAIYAMVRDFKRRGVPIDGVGLQMHIPDLNVDVRSISENIRRFTALGVQVHITEMDVSLPVDANGDARPDDLLRQAGVYGQIANACLSSPGCTAIQTWGFTDKYSWIGSHSHKTRGTALLFDRRYNPKPAYQAFLNALQTRQR